MKQLCHYSDIEESSAKGFNIEGTPLFVVKKEGAVYVYQNLCPHLSIPLEYAPNQFLDSEERFIICSNHGALFNIENGACVSGPCVDDALTPIQHTVKDNCIYVNI